MAERRGSHVTSLDHPVTRSKKSRTQRARKAYQSPSVVPGVRHFTEGRDNLEYKQVDEWRRPVMGSVGKHDPRGGKYYKTIPTKGGAKSKAYNEGIDQQIAGFGMEDRARSKLRTIADPDEMAKRERKRSARRRMRGRLGTLLSERETLG